MIREYARERTCIVISHDMDFIAGVSDRILVLNGGKCVEQGSHEELLARGGLYRQLYEGPERRSDAADVWRRYGSRPIPGPAWSHVRYDRSAPVGR